jgi:hypothetical protein
VASESLTTPKTMLNKKFRKALMSNLKNLPLILKTTKQLKKFSSLQEVQRAFTVQTISCRQLVHYYLENIENKKHLNAFLEVYEQEALAKADEIDEKLKNGIAGSWNGNWT